MKKLALILIIAASIGCKTSHTSLSTSEIFQGEDNEWTTKDISQNRDMSQYKQGGHFWCSRRPFGNEQDQFNGEKKVRDFIWQHWIQKQRGYIMISCGGTDTSDTTHYFIEPNERNEWIVTLRYFYKHSISPQFDRNGDSVAVSVEQAKHKNKNDEIIIILKEKNDRIVEEIPFYH